MNSTERDRLNALSIETLPKVIEAGERLGFWKEDISERKEPDRHATWRWASVEDAEGNRFSFSAGGWGKEGTISVTLGHATGPGGKKYGAYEVKRYGESTPEASASAKRPPEAIAKDLARRLTQNPEAVDLARRIRQYVATLHEHRAQLVAQVEALQKLGFRTYRDEGVPAQESYQTQMYGDGLPTIKVTYTGWVTFDASTSVDRMGDVLTALRTEPTP